MGSAESSVRSGVVCIIASSPSSSSSPFSFLLLPPGPSASLVGGVTDAPLLWLDAELLPATLNYTELSRIPIAWSNTNRPGCMAAAGAMGRPATA